LLLGGADRSVVLRRKCAAGSVLRLRTRARRSTRLCSVHHPSALGGTVTGSRALLEGLLARRALRARWELVRRLAIL